MHLCVKVNNSRIITRKNEQRIYAHLSYVFPSISLSFSRCRHEQFCRVYTRPDSTLISNISYTITTQQHKPKRRLCLFTLCMRTHIFSASTTEFVWQHKRAWLRSAYIWIVECSSEIYALPRANRPSIICKYIYIYIWSTRENLSWTLFVCIDFRQILGMQPAAAYKIVCMVSEIVLYDVCVYAKHIIGSANEPKNQ